MQLTELTLTNWGPFFGDHSIPLNVGSSAPVVLVRGENMRGKTSLLRSIIWCLYGHLKEQDGKTPFDVSRMVNIDALADGDIEFGVTLRFTHNGAEYKLHRSAQAREERPGRVSIARISAQLLPTGAQAIPVEQIPQVVDGILNHEISDFYFFDGEMLNRFEERLREDRANAQGGWVRTQVERALGLPFMKDLEGDLDTIQRAITASMDQALKRAKKHTDLSNKLEANSDELKTVEHDLSELRETDEQLLTEISDLDQQLSHVDAIKDLFYERKSLETEVANARDTIQDLRSQLAEQAETTWWLPASGRLAVDLEESEQAVREAEDADRERFKLGFKLDQLREQLGSGICPTCGQPVASHGSDDLKAEIARVEADLAGRRGPTVDEARSRRDKLRPFAAGPARVARVFELEQDLGRESLRNDKREQRIRQIGEQISGNTVDIESLERNLVDRKAARARIASAIKSLEERQRSLRDLISALSKQIADTPEVDQVERELKTKVDEALDVLKRSFDGFSAAMRDRVAQETSALFRRLTTEPEYSGVSISPDYALSVLDAQGRSLRTISAGANQILTTAFIGALATCSVDEAPMVMDTPLGRLDQGHRAKVLEWISTFDTQVILFVQSGEYDPRRDAHLLAGRVGREFTIERLSDTRSEVRVA